METFGPKRQSEGARIAVQSMVTASGVAPLPGVKVKPVMLTMGKQLSGTGTRLLFAKVCVAAPSAGAPLPCAVRVRRDTPPKVVLMVTSYLTGSVSAAPRGICTTVVSWPLKMLLLLAEPVS